MRLLVRDGKKSDAVRSTAIALTSSLPAKDWCAEIFALFDFVQNCIRYQRDIRDVETIATADQVLAQGAGDCDDKVILLAALLESIGHPTQLFAMGFARGELTHVILLVGVGDPVTQWIPLDATEDQEPGWLPPGIAQRMFLDNGDG